MNTSRATLYSRSSSNHYFGCELGHILNLAVLDTPGGNSYAQAFQQKLVSFVTSLINFGDERFTFDLRTLSAPDSTNYHSGKIEIALLCRVSGMSAKEAAGYASGLQRYLESHFLEYAFSQMSAPGIMRFLSPFRMRTLWGIQRRCVSEELNSLRRGTARVGFQAVDKAAPGRSRESSPSILHVFPFLAGLGNHLPLYRLMLLEPAPMAISVRMRPTELYSEEEEFLERQIAICDSCATHGPVYIPDDLSSLRATLQEQARLYHQHQTRFLFGLQDNAAIATIEIAAAHELSRFVLDAIGSFITEPAGGISSWSEGSEFHYLAGGYEVRQLTRQKEFKQGFTELNITIPDGICPNPAAKRLPFMFDSIQLSAAFKLPPATAETPLGLRSLHWRARPAPSTLSQEGVLIGHNTLPNSVQEIRVSPDERFKHFYIVGQTGTGKSTVLRTMVLDDIQKGAGVCVIDPHGDLYSDILSRIPEHRLDDVVLLDPTDINYPFGINLLEYKNESQRHFIIQEFTEIIRRLTQDEFDTGDELIGPMFIMHLRMNLALITSDSSRPSTLMDLYSIFCEQGAWKKWLPLKSQDPFLENWVKHTLPKADYFSSGGGYGSFGAYVGSKFDSFIFDPVCRNIFGQPSSTIDFRQIMDSGKILLVNLARGELTAPNSRLLGMIVLAKIQAAVMARSEIPERERKAFHIYVDEFQNIATQNFINLLSEARKFRVSLVLANQFLSQLRNRKITDAIFGNVGTVISFRLGQEDAELMEREMGSSFTRTDLVNLPNWRACVSTLVDGEAEAPFTVGTINKGTLPASRARARKARGLSRARYCKSLVSVQKSISQRHPMP